MMDNYQEIQKTLSVLSSLILQDDVESSEKLVLGLELLDKQLTAFLKTNPKLEKNELISLMAKVDSLNHVAKNKSNIIKKSVMQINQNIKANKGYNKK